MPKRRDPYEDDEDPFRIRKPAGLPGYALAAAVGMILSSAIALLLNGLLFCVGFHEEFLSNARPDPVGVVLLMLLALAILASAVGLAAGLFMVMARRYWLAIVGCPAVAIATHIVPLGLAVGIIGLILLLQPDVKEAFR